MLISGVNVSCKLALRDSTHGAGTSAGTAVQASTGIDHVVISTLRDSAYGAGISASTAADTSVTNNICHNESTSIKMYFHFITSFKKCNANFL